LRIEVAKSRKKGAEGCEPRRGLLGSRATAAGILVIACAELGTIGGSRMRRVYAHEELAAAIEQRRTVSSSRLSAKAIAGIVLFRVVVDAGEVGFG